MHISFVHHHHPALVVDAPVAVVQAIDGRIELIVAAYRHHDVFAVAQLFLRYFGRRKYRFPRRRVEFLFPRTVGQIESARFAYPAVVVFKARHHLLDGIADMVVVAHHFIPIDLAFSPDCCFSHARHDSRLAFEVYRRRVEHALRGVHHAHRVFYTDKLLPGLLRILIGTAKAGQYQRFLAVDEVAAVELSRDLHGEAALFQRFRRVFGIRCGRDKVSTQGEEDGCLLFVHGFDRIHYGVPVLAGRFKPEGCFQFI